MSRFFALMSLLALALSGCESAPHADSIVLVVIDTCRVDHVGVTRDGRALTPSLDAFGKESTDFAKAFSHAPWTLPSFASLFTSRIPARHGAGGHLGEFRELAGDAVTLAEVCRDAGMATAAITNVQFLTSQFGMTQGFDHVDPYVPTSNQDMRRASDTVDVALAWLERSGGEPFLLLVHIFDPHLLYDPPQPFRHQFAADEDQESGPPLFGMFGQIQSIRNGELELPPEAYRRLGGLYDGEIAYSDAEFARLLTGIESLGLDSRTVIAITSDHGEEFGDHGSFEHGHSLYDELLRVPLQIRAPSIEVAQTVSVEVGLIDVAPTLCDLIGMVPPATFQGRSLRPAMLGEQIDALPILSQGNMWGDEMVSLRDGDWKLITEIVADPESGDRELALQLFNLADDPVEQQNLAAERPGIRNAMLKELDRLLAGQRDEGDAPTLSEEERERLRTLGY